ncbi:MAG: hypothetical protein ABIF12_02265 [bacterium]
MIGQALYKSLKNLVIIDKEINELNFQIKQTETILKKDLEQIPLLESEIKISENEISKQKKNMALLELNARALREKEKALREKLENISNPKEYKSLEKEIKLIEHNSLQQEDELLKVWHQLEALQKEFAENKIKNDEKIKQLSEGMIAQKKALEDQIENNKILNEKRLSAIKDIPAEWLSKYERMKHKVSNPIVPVLNFACNACYYSILHQDITKLKQGSILPCRNCYRFLYYDEQEEKEAKLESF